MAGTEERIDDETGDPLWVFGYGSLVWRPAFAYVEKRAGVIRGYWRRFWQGSTDHRGTPVAPGRVVTLIPAEAGHCWGMAYRVSSDERVSVLANLDHRERAGFSREQVEVRFGSGRIADRVAALVYIATESNPNYLGPASEVDIANQIRACHGPSGSNIEYALRLADELRAIGADDDHVFAVAGLLDRRDPR